MCDHCPAHLVHITFQARRIGGQVGAVQAGADTRPIRSVEFVKLTDLPGLGFSDQFVQLCRAGFPDAGSSTWAPRPTSACEQPWPAAGTPGPATLTHHAGACRQALSSADLGLPAVCRGIGADAVAPAVWRGVWRRSGSIPRTIQSSATCSQSGSVPSMCRSHSYTAVPNANCLIFKATCQLHTTTAERSRPWSLTAAAAGASQTEARM